MTGQPPAVGTVFTLPNDVIASIRGTRWVITSTTSVLVRFRVEGDPRVGKRPITTSLERWEREAAVVIEP